MQGKRPQDGGERLRVIVVGAGIGGLALTLALRRRGLDVTVLEQAAAFGEVGAGLQLSPNATRILERWGLGPALAGVASRPQAAEVRLARTGRRLMRTPLGEAAEARWGAAYLHVHRADLHAVLTEAVAREGGAAPRLGIEVKGVETEEGRAVARLVGGDVVEADVLVGADGLRSTVRESVAGPAAPRFTGQVAWRALVPVERLPAGLIPPVAALWVGRGRHLVHYPVRRGGLINVVGVVEGDWRLESWIEPGDPAAWAADFAGWAEPVPTLLRAVDRAWRWALYDRPPLRRWSRGRAVLLGDAAHPMLPFLAQGAAMAIEDAEALAAHLADRSGSIEGRLRAYELERFRRAARVQRASRRNATLFHLPNPAGEAAFGAAALIDGARGSAARFNWLYSYDRERDGPL